MFYLVPVIAYTGVELHISESLCDSELKHGKIRKKIFYHERFVTRIVIKNKILLQKSARERRLYLNIKCFFFQLFVNQIVFKNNYIDNCVRLDGHFCYNKISCTMSLYLFSFRQVFI